MIELVPAIDLIDGQCVRLTRGDYDSKKVYGRDPLAVARGFEAFGFKRLHVVDLDGARAGKVINRKVLEKITSGTSLCVDFGGGIQSKAEVETVFSCGAEMLICGSLAAKDPETVIALSAEYPGRIILGADARNGEIAVGGWEKTTGKDIFSFLSYFYEKGMRKTVCTDIGRDGTLGGPAIEWYKKIMEKFPGLYLIASGGVSSVRDIEILDETGIPAVIFGKAFYEGKLEAKELEKFL